MPCEIINRSKGQFILPDKRILKRNSSLVVEEINAELHNLEKKGSISIHPCARIVCNADWCSYMVDAACSAKTEIIPGYGPGFNWGENRSFDFRLQLPYNYLPHSSLIPYLKWVPINNFKQSNSIWKVQYFAISNGVVIANTLESTLSVPIGKSGPVTTKLPEISGEEFYENTVIKGVVSREGSDNRDDFLGIIAPNIFEIRYQLKPKNRIVKV